MSTKKKKPTPKKAWHPLERNPQWWVDQQAERVFADIQKRYPDIPKEAIEEQISDETWGSDTYTVNVHYQGGDRDGFVELAIHNHNRTTHVPWRHMQQIKNEILGEEREGVQIFPAESRLIDTANEYWIYVYPTGKSPMFNRKTKLGMNYGRQVSDEQSPFGKVRQAPEMEIAQ